MNLFALREFAKTKNPTASLPPNVLLLETPQCIAIFDSYPKALYHFLVLPKIPISVSGHKRLTEAELDSLSSVLAVPEHREVFSALKEAATEVIDMVRDEMIKSHGFEWDINVGFHSVPSMRHLHLHVISSDLVSPCLKTKKHYNSFNPKLGFFIPLNEADTTLNIVKRDKEELLKTHLRCLHCNKDFSTMPSLKNHLDEEFSKIKARQLKR